MNHPKYRWVSKDATHHTLTCVGSTMELGAVRKRPGKNVRYSAYTYIVEGVNVFDTIPEAKAWVEMMVKDEYAKLKESV